ncbi:MAG: hypothetical protein IK104_08925 [Clostridia bacterium]|nr:hypothetical protein [Clostridia bacterium]
MSVGTTVAPSSSFANAAALSAKTMAVAISAFSHLISIATDAAHNKPAKTSDTQINIAFDSGSSPMYPFSFSRIIASHPHINVQEKGVRFKRKHLHHLEILCKIHNILIKKLDCSDKLWYDKPSFDRNRRRCIA